MLQLAPPGPAAQVENPEQVLPAIMIRHTRVELIVELVQLLIRDGVGFVVYRAELTFREPAHFGDSLEIHTTVAQESDYRLVFQQEARKDKRLLVSSMIQLACVDAGQNLVPIPPAVVARLAV